MRHGGRLSVGSPLGLRRCTDYLSFQLEECTRSKALRQGKQIHAQILTTRLTTDVGVLASKLVGMYACCGCVQHAELVFERIRSPSVFAWNWMILGCAFHGECRDALGWFSMMQKADVFPNKYTFPSVLKAVIGVMDVEKGKQLHCSIMTRGFECIVSVANALVDMYAKCRDLYSARRVFDEMPQRDVATWTIIVCGYAQAGLLHESGQLFDRMKREGAEPNEFTWNAMVAAHAENGDCGEALDFFNRMKKEGVAPDVVTWNAMIVGFNRNGMGALALKLLREMVSLGLKLNAITAASVLPACGAMGMLCSGKQLHCVIYRQGLDRNIHVGTALIDMYAKCGRLSEARKVFDQLPAKTVACWNAMIGCYGKHGRVEDSLMLFEQMLKAGLEPSQVTFTNLLSSCSHCGLVDEGLKVFRLMRDNCDIEINPEHYACIVDLLCRAGKLTEACELVMSMPMQVTESVMGAFLGGCRIHGRNDLAEKLVKEVVGEMGTGKAAAGFVTMSNMHAAAGKWEEVEDVRKVMKEKGIRKKPGCSWVETASLGQAGFGDPFRILEGFT
ncbi:pentatricopeptide repeat-containing protein At5g59600-like [Nymphaea colorata]|uniref:Pentacotripeptide-repeat region of PRORP domain-containing protein n=1 Tax=Nymphaea colorata TaxID=210225 RepID=A0A5K1EIN5_9MAGN|nr:pentatricopeptide repeat-containing protein At5g59600-like [Nymphaea colorata]